MILGRLPLGISALALMRRHRGRLSGSVLPVLALIFVTIFLALIVFGSSRSFLVEAQTDGVQISFGDGQNLWRLPNAILCVPLDAPSLKPDAVCGQASAPEGQAREWLLDWSDNAVINLHARDDGGLEVNIIEPGSSTLPERGMLILSKSAWRGAGALTFQASVTVGQDMQTGADKFLRDGRWEAREAGIVTSFFRSLTEVVKSGDLSTGSKVVVLSNGKPAKVYGHVIPAREGGLAVTMISEFGNTALSVRHFGLDDPVLIEPDWIDVAISSPLLLAMAVLFSVLASVSQILSDSSGGDIQNPKTSRASDRQKSPR